MPDHVHFVIEGLSETSDPRSFVARWKQATGYRYAVDTGRRLWMSGYHDHVLRDGESTMEFVQYVMRNPVRAGLARRVGEFEFAGSDVFTDQELREILEERGQ
jgi:putative transposase